MPSMVSSHELLFKNMAPAPLSILLAAYRVRTQLPKVADARDKLLSVIVPVMHAHHTVAKTHNYAKIRHYRVGAF